MTIRNWYTTRVIEAAHQAVNLDAAALWVEGQAKANVGDNGQVDTGFMRASIYAVLSSGSRHAEAAAEASGHEVGKDGRRRNKSGDMASSVTLTGNARAAVAAGAIYSFWQERSNSFLLRALEQLDMQSVVRRI